MVVSNVFLDRLRASKYYFKTPNKKTVFTKKFFYKSDSFKEAKFLANLAIGAIYFFLLSLSIGFFLNNSGLYSKCMVS